MCALSTQIAFAPERVRIPEPQTRAYCISLVRNMSPTWLALEVERAATAGFNVLIFPVYNNGWTLFPSETARSYGLPAVNPIFKKWSPLGELTNIARRAGLPVWGVTRPYFFHPRYSIAEHRLLRKFPQWRMRAHPERRGPETGVYEFRHPCPLNHDYQRFLASVLSELTQSYPVEGVVIQFNGFGLRSGSMESSPYCFCASCRGLYAEERKGNLAQDAVAGKLDVVRAWQAEKAVEHLEYLRSRLLRTRRTCRLIGWVRPTWRCESEFRETDHGRNVPLDWPAALASSTIDELAVDHDGDAFDHDFGGRLAADYAYLGDQVLWQPVLSIKKPDELGTYLEALKRYPTPGFIGEFQSSLTEETALAIRGRYFSEAAPVPESEPVRTAIFLLDRVRRAHEDQPMLHDLISDFLRVLARQIPTANDFPVLEMIEQNIHGLEQYIRRGRLGSTRILERTMRDLGLARRFVRMACMDVRS